MSVLVHRNAQLEQVEGQSETAKRRELQEQIELLRADIGHLDSQISATEEQLATEGKVFQCRGNAVSSLGSSK